MLGPEGDIAAYPAYEHFEVACWCCRRGVISSSAVGKGHYRRVASGCWFDARRACCYAGKINRACHYPSAASQHVLRMVVVAKAGEIAMVGRLHNGAGDSTPAEDYQGLRRDVVYGYGTIADPHPIATPANRHYVSSEHASWNGKLYAPVSCNLCYLYKNMLVFTIFYV